MATRADNPARTRLLFKWMTGMLVDWFTPKLNTPPPLDGRLDRRARRQVGALCWRREDGVLQVLLVTSRDTGRWIIPKGNRMADRDDAAAAAQEAWEEAGVVGKVGEKHIGSYHYVKRLARGGERRTAVDVYPLKVRELRKDWPERKERMRRWFTPVEAIAAVSEPELKALIASFEA